MQGQTTTTITQASPPSSELSPIRPFEWLTSPESLQNLVESLGLPREKSSALHIGSGSSILGEYLVERLGFEQVVDVDKDEETIERMRKRWQDRCTANHNFDRLRHEVVDFTQDTIPVPTASTDLVLDKSTLDCTLCSDNATASLLMEVYRCLAVGGTYLVISFHEADLLLPLLRDLPGAQWNVTRTTMNRQVERLDSKKRNDNAKEINGNSEELATVSDTNSSPSSKPLNVIMATKVDTFPELSDVVKMGNETNINNTNNASHGDQQISSPHHLNFSVLCQHVHRVNDAWFQQSQPLLTRQREDYLRTVFMKPLQLTQAYNLLFTAAEREHLTYEHFLEDWDVFCLNQQGDQIEVAEDDSNVATTKTVSYDTAIAFLREMQ